MFNLSRTPHAHLLLFIGLTAMSATSAAATLEADPMRPPQTSSASPSNKPATHYYHLSSILISPTRRSAIVNGRRVNVGDWVGDARVTAIQGNQVTLSIAGRYRTLTLLPLSIKKPAEAPRP